MTKILPILRAPALFEQCRLDSELRELRPLSGIDNLVFDNLIKEPLWRYAEAVQLAPASENHHHSGPGGLLTHTVDVIALALKMRRGFQLPLGGSVSEISEQRHLWTYGVFIACLLHDIGKLSSSIRLTVRLKDGSMKSWTPQSEPLSTIKNAVGYTIQFKKTPYHYHDKLSLIHFDLIPRHARDWLAQSSQIMMELLSYLWGDRYESGTIGQIAERADRESTARNLQIPVEKTFSNSIPVIDRYLKLIRTWIAEGVIRVNVPGGMGWVDASGHIYLVCRSLAEKLIVECNEMGLKNLPQEPVRIYDILQEHGYALSTEDEKGVSKAIWTVQVKTADFAYQLTCLKFEARRLIPSNKTLSPLNGEINVLSKKDMEDLEKSGTEENKIQASNSPEVVKTTTAPAETADRPEEPGENSALEKLKALTKNEDQISGRQADNQETDAQASVENMERAEAPAEQAQDKRTEATTTPEESVTQKLSQETPLTSGHKIQEPAFEFSAPETPKRFISWLKKGLIEKTILINDVAAEVHIVKEGIFLLAPAIFKTWLNINGFDGEKLHKNLSKRFARQRVHVRNGDMNIHSYWVKSSNRASKINGWLLPFNVVYENDYPIPQVNKYITKELFKASADTE